MSLKAKIEAVIYASEEPVTLAQLAGLLGQEAQAELDHLESAQQSLALNETAQDETIQGETGEAPTVGAPAPLTEPEPTDSAPASEPEPNESSPIPEHPAESSEAAAEKSARDQKLDE